MKTELGAVYCTIEPKSWKGKEIVILGGGRKMGLRLRKSQLNLLFLLFNLKMKQFHTTEILW